MALDKSLRDVWHFSEFQKGDFSSLSLYNYCDKNSLLDALLLDENTAQNLKKYFIKHIIRKVKYIADSMNNEYMLFVRESNSSVRDHLRYMYNQTPRWYKTFNAYNNAYREMYWGKSFVGKTVTQLDHEWHSRYKEELEKHMLLCLGKCHTAGLLDDDYTINFVDAYFGKWTVERYRLLCEKKV